MNVEKTENILIETDEGHVIELSKNEAVELCTKLQKVLYIGKNVEDKDNPSRSPWSENPYVFWNYKVGYPYNMSEDDSVTDPLDPHGVGGLHDTIGFHFRD